MIWSIPHSQTEVMATRTIKKMLENLPVGMVDVVRLFVEAVEDGGLADKTRGEIIVRFQRVERVQSSEFD